MSQHSRTDCRWAICVLIVAVAMAAQLGAQSAKGGTKEEFTAVTQNMNVGRQGIVDMVVEKWSPDGDRDALLKVFVDKGQDAMLRELQRRPKLGYLKLPNTLGWDIHYAVQQPLPDGGRRVVIVTDRPIGMGEAIRDSRSTDYPFTMIEIRFNSEGVGVGKLSTGTKINKSKDGQHLELETWATEPVRLSEVKSKSRK
jgi:hypothetical protein